MGKWVLALAAMAACLFVGYQTTFSGDKRPPRSHVSAGPDCIGTLRSRANAFPSEIALVEKAWGEPIPTELARIGGVDWWGWARICRENGGWVGEYRDASYRYVGPFTFVTPDGEPAGFDPVGTYYLSHYDWERGLLLYRIEPEDPPVSYYFMRLAEPDLLEQRQPDG